MPLNTDPIAICIRNAAYSIVASGVQSISKLDFNPKMANDNLPVEIDFINKCLG